MLAKELVQNGLSLNRALALVKLSKSTYFYESKEAHKNEALARRLRELALENPAYGYRRLWHLLREEGFLVNQKRVYRLYRKLELGLPRRKKRGYRRSRHFEEDFPLEPAKRPGERWSIDFKEERLSDGTKVRILQVLDEYSRFFLGAWPDRRIGGEEAGEYLDHLCLHYGPPLELRRDDGPEFRSQEFQKICRKWRIRQIVIPPASPYWNGIIESFHGKEEEEWLSREIIEDFEKFCEGLERFWWYYNYQRPHSALGYRCPGEIWNEWYFCKRSGSQNGIDQERP